MEARQSTEVSVDTAAGNTGMVPGPKAKSSPGGNIFLSYCELYNVSPAFLINGSFARSTSKCEGGRMVRRHQGPEDTGDASVSLGWPEAFGVFQTQSDLSSFYEVCGRKFKPSPEVMFDYNGNLWDAEDDVQGDQGGQGQDGSIASVTSREVNVWLATAGYWSPT